MNAATCSVCQAPLAPSCSEHPISVSRELQVHIRDAVREEQAIRLAAALARAGGRNPYDAEPAAGAPQQEVGA